MLKEKHTMATNPLLTPYTYYLVIVVSVALAILLGQLIREKSRKLQQHGRRVIAIVTNVQQEREERGPPEFPLINYCYYIEAQWIDPRTGNTYRFKSQRLASSPKEYSPGKFVPVLIDPNNPTRYTMELPEYDI